MTVASVVVYFNMERSDEEIVHCINSCWPEFPFGIPDIRRPSGEKMREILLRFLKTFISGNYQLPNVSSHYQLVFF